MGLPDLVSHVEPRVAELVFDGSKLLMLRDINGSFDHPTQGLFHLRTELLHEFLDPFIARCRDRNVLAGTSHGCLRGTRSGVDLPALANLSLEPEVSHPSTSCTPNSKWNANSKWLNERITGIIPEE